MTKDELRKQIDAFEKDSSIDDALQQLRATVTRLEAQRAAARLDTKAKEQAHADLTMGAVEAAGLGRAYPEKALLASMTALAAARQHESVLQGAVVRATSQLNAAEADREATFAARYQPLLADAVAFLDSRISDLAAAEALVERLENIAKRELHPVRWTSHHASHRFSLPNAWHWWRERMTELGLFKTA
jgi:hypothetical protein